MATRSRCTTPKNFGAAGTHNTSTRNALSTWESNGENGRNKPGELWAVTAISGSTDDADQILRSFFGRLTVSRHMVANVVFHECGHEAVDGSSCRREPLEDVPALFVIVESTRIAFSCPMTFFVRVISISPVGQGEATSFLRAQAIATVSCLRCDRWPLE